MMAQPRCVRVEGVPAPYDGPYDLEGSGYRLSDDGGIVVRLRLGMLYDFYALEAPCRLPLRWELWHLDSAVCHVDPECIQEGAVFDAPPVELACEELQLIVRTPTIERRFEGMQVAISPLEITFRLDLETRLVLAAEGWTLHERGAITHHADLEVRFGAA
jgi:hypothetical protein